MVREFVKAACLILSIASLYTLLGAVFFVPGIPWQHRLENSVETLAISACICFASGLVFCVSARSELTLLRTLPVQLFFWSFGGTVLLFALSRYLETYYVPLLWKNQPY